MKIKINLRNYRRCFLWTILLLPIYKPGYASEAPLLEAAYDFGRIISITACLIIVIFKSGIIFKDKDLNIIYLAKLWILTMTISNGVDNMDTFYSFVLVVIQGVLYTYMLKK